MDKRKIVVSRNNHKEIYLILLMLQDLLQMRLTE